jgi:iron complex outermembrane recepter protein
VRLNSPLYDTTALKAFSQELRIASDGGGTFEWLAGAFYQDIDRDYGQNLPTPGYDALMTRLRFPVSTAVNAPPDTPYFSRVPYDFKQFALFGEGTVHFSDQWSLTGGLRYYDFEEDRVQVFDGIFADPIDSVGSTSADGFAPRGIVSFKLNSNVTLNAQVSKGFRLGGINDPLNRPLCTPQDLAIYQGFGTWEDETLWNYEVGAKTSIAGGRGTFNASVYVMDIENLQATVTAGSCSSRIILNVPKAQTQGLEAEFEIAPNDSFDFAISGSFNNSELESSFLDSSGNIVAGIRKGNRLPTVPEFQMAAAATYRKPFTGFVGYVTGVYQHIGDRFTQIGDQAAGFGRVQLDSFAGDIGGPYTQSVFTFNPEMPSYDIVNLRVGILKGVWDAALFINNVTDEEAFLALDQERGTRARVGHLTNQPRTVGISTRFNF